jgi:hypothetical protein
VKIDSQQNQPIGSTVTPKRSPLRWCLILSLIVHGVGLCIFLLLPRPEMGRSSFVRAVLAPSSPEETTPVETKTFNEKAERPKSGATRQPSAQNAGVRAPRQKEPSLPNSPPLGPESSSSPAEATPVPNEEAFGPGGTASQSGGIDIGSAGISPSGKGTTAGGAGSAGNSAVSTGPSSGQHDTSGYRGAPGTRPGGGIFQPAISTPPLKMPAEEFRGLLFALSEVYIEVDRYVLYGHNLRQGISVPSQRDLSGRRLVAYQRDGNLQENRNRHVEVPDDARR